MGMLLLAAYSAGCSEKKIEDNQPVNIIAWTKPLQYRDTVSWTESLTKKADNGFIASGFLAYNDSQIRHGFVIDMDADADTLWCRKVDFEGFTYCNILYAVEKTPDEILLAGICGASGKEQNRFIAWMGKEGNLTKQVWLPVLEEEYIWDCKIFPSANGNIFFVSFVSSLGGSSLGDNSLKIDMLSGDGEIIGSNNYLNVNATLERMVQLEDGTLMLTGSTFPGNSPDNNEILFLTIDQNGNEVYRREFGSDSWDVGHGVCTNNSGGYLVSGELTYACKSAIFPISGSGEVGNYFYVADTIQSHRTFIERASGNDFITFILSSERLYLIKLGPDFHVKWTFWLEHYPGSYTSLVFYDIIRMNDGSFAFLYEGETSDIIIKTIPL